jgi:hypothetical protein
MIYVFYYIISCIPIILYFYKYVDNTGKVQIINLLIMIYIILPLIIIFTIFAILCFTYPVYDLSYKFMLYRSHKNKLKILKNMKIFNGSLFLKLSQKLENMWLIDSYTYFEPFIGLKYLDKQLKNNELYESQILNIIGEYLEE